MASLAGAPPALAQDPIPPGLRSLSLEDLMQVEIAPVFGASKRLQPVTQAPASVTIVTAEDMARFGYRTLAEVLRGVRGLYVSDDRNYSYLGARGVSQPGDYNTRILLLVDGHRLNDNIYDQAQIGYESGLDMGTVDRVEIIRGPASALYGTNAFFAVVNVITKSGAALGGFRLAVDTGSFDERAVRLSYGRLFESGMDLALSGRFGEHDGTATLFYPEFGGVARGLDGEQSTQLSARMTTSQLALRAGYGRREKQVPTAAYATVFGDPRFRTTDSHLFVDAQHDRQAGDTQLSFRAYLDRYRYDGSYPSEGWDGLPDAVLYEDYADGIWWGVEGRATRTIGARHTLILGGELRHNARQNQGGAYIGLDEGAFAIAESSRAFGAFAQDDVRLGSHVLMTLGARYDAYEGTSRVSPRAALIISPTANEAFKYLYGSAYRAPNAYERDYYTGGVVDPMLEPETVTSHEVVWERYIGHWLRTSASGYLTDVDRLITFEGEGFDDYRFVNRGRVEARGLELEAEARLRNGLLAGGHWVWQRAHDADTDELLTNSPRQAGGFRLSTSGPWRSRLSGEVQALGPRRTLAGTRERSAVLTHLTALVPIGTSLRLQAGVRNLFDRAYADPGSAEHRQVVIPQNGRTWRVGLDWLLR